MTVLSHICAAAKIHAYILWSGTGGDRPPWADSVAGQDGSNGAVSVSTNRALDFPEGLKS